MFYMVGNSSRFSIVRKNFNKKLFQEYQQSVKHFGTQIKPDIKSGLTWVQTVCKDYLLIALCPNSYGNYDTYYDNMVNEWSKQRMAIGLGYF